MSMEPIIDLFPPLSTELYCHQKDWQFQAWKVAITETDIIINWFPCQNGRYTKSPTRPEVVPSLETLSCHRHAYVWNNKQFKICEMPAIYLNKASSKKMEISAPGRRYDQLSVLPAKIKDAISLLKPVIAVVTVEQCFDGSVHHWT